MAKTSNLHIRIDPELQKKAEKVLKKLGMSIPDAITVFLNQVYLRGGLPFQVTLPEDSSYFYGFELPEMSYEPKESFKYFREKVITPGFREKYDKWLDSAMGRSKEMLGDKWDEDSFWFKIFHDDPGYGNFDSFSKLYGEFGLKLEYCYSNNEVNSGIPPCVAGVYLTRADEKRVSSGEKPRVFISLCRKFRRIISDFKDDDLQVFEVFDEETEKMMANIYDPNDPNFMTKDDY